MNTKQSSLILVGSISALSALSGAAPFTVEHFTLVGPHDWERDTANEGTEYTVVENPAGSNNWDFTLIQPNNVQWNIKAHDPAVDSINRIIANAGGQFFTVIVGDAGGPLPSTGPYDYALVEQLSPGCKNFNGITPAAGAGDMKLVIVASGSINGNIEVEEAARLRAVSITADIENDPAADKLINIETSGDFSGSYLSWGAPLQSFQVLHFTGDVDIRGDVGRFEVTSAPITGSMICEGFDASLSPLTGVLFNDSSTADLSVEADLPPVSVTINGDFGGQIQIDGDLTPNSKIEINGTLLSTGEIDIRGEMLADSEIQVGLISVPPAVETGGRIEIRDEIRDDAEIGVLDDFNGQMILDDLEGGVTIFGDAGATSLITMDTLAFNLGGSLFIGDALAGQVIINQQNNSSTWDGFVWANGYEFQESEAQPEQAPHYDVLSDDLGGGAIGLVPFDLHGPDTVAANAGSLSQSSGGQAPQSIELHHYGRVLDVSAPGALPVLVERTTQYQVPGQPIVWTDVSDEFEASIVGRVLTISAKPGEDGFTCAHDYRISPEAGRLVCEDLATDTVDVASYLYEFGVRCKIDLSGNGIIDTPDPVLWWRTRWT